MPQDFIELLIDDHEEARNLIEQILSADDAGERGTLFEELDAALRVHSLVEEEIVYPAIRDVEGDGETRSMVEEAKEEHEEAEALLNELASAGADDDSFMDLMDQLKDAVTHHIEEEENEMFAKAKQKLSDGERKRIGDRVAKRKDELQAKSVQELRS